MHERLNACHECLAADSILYYSILYTDEVVEGYAAVSENFKTPKKISRDLHCRRNVVYMYIISTM